MIVNILIPIISCLILQSAAHSDPLEMKDNQIVRGNHPFNDSLNAWYLGLDTALGGHVYIGDVLDQTLKMNNYLGEPVNLHLPKDERSENYENLHNHYQNLFVQTINKIPNVNAVSVWGDSTSIVDGAKSWGGFFSARSACHVYAKDGPLSKYGTNLTQSDCNKNDNQLIGIEIDVLNSSKPGVFPNMSKTGLQVVGFGNPNSMAIEIRTEDTDRLNNDKSPRGAFESLIYAKNSIQPDYGRMVVADFDKAKIGLDFRRPIFTNGVMAFNTQGIGTGIIANNGNAGEIFGGTRWPGDKNLAGWMSFRLGSGGSRFVSNDNTKEVMAIDNFGGIYLNGDVFLNGQKISLTTNGLPTSQVYAPWLSKKVWVFIGFILLVNALLTLIVARLYTIWHLKRIG